MRARPAELVSQRLHTPRVLLTPLSHTHALHTPLRAPLPRPPHATALARLCFAGSFMFIV